MPTGHDPVSGEKTQTDPRKGPKEIGRYLVKRMIREGGFGAVYECRDPNLHRTVAVKAFRSFSELDESGDFNSSEYKERFESEARIAARLDHPNLTKVYDFGETDGGPFIVQEYLHGTDLDHIIRREREISLTDKLRYLLEIAKGMAYAHSQGIIHRDIKPSNVKITPGGPGSTAKIMDFGLAKSVTELPMALLEFELSHSYQFMGTLFYCAPEQLQHKKIDRRADIFNFGILAYEFVCYKHPFCDQDYTPAVIMSNILSAEPPPLAEHMKGGYSQRLERLIRKCLRKRPGARYQSFDKIVKDLEFTIEHLDPTEPIPSAILKLISRSGGLSKILKAYFEKKAERALALWGQLVGWLRKQDKHRKVVAAAVAALLLSFSLVIGLGREDVEKIEVVEIEASKEFGRVKIVFEVETGLLSGEYYRVTRDPPWKRYPRKNCMEYEELFSFEDDEDLVIGQSYEYLIQRLNGSRTVLGRSSRVTVTFD